MGGKAARERRRLERHPGNAGEKQGSAAVTSPKAFTKNKVVHRHQQAVQPSKYKYVRQVDARSKFPVRSAGTNPRHARQDPNNRLPPNARRGPPKRYDGTKGETNDRKRIKKPKEGEDANKKPKVKKPKHLKRKLEKLDEDDMETREKLIDVLHSFEETKALRSNSSSLTSQAKKHPKQNRTEKDIHPQQEREPRQQQREVKPVLVKVTADISKEINTSNPVPEPVCAKNDTLVTELTKDKELVKDVHSFIIPDENPNEMDESDSDSDVGAGEEARRQRGRRRRGRKDTSAIPEPSQVIEDPPNQGAADESDSERDNLTTENGEHTPKQTAEGDESNEGTVSKNNRRCIGRKPVTDFTVGQRYSGKVVYVKPFGAFLDIGCHSDAFCHVSRLQDDYVESAGDVLKVGDEVNARVVEVDRKEKKITVSLQSDARLDDEKASLEARKNRAGKRGKAKDDKPGKLQRTDDSRVIPNPSTPKFEKKPTPTIREEKPIDESSMDAAEIKRARKLARRAARRAQQEETGIAA